MAAVKLDRSPASVLACCRLCQWRQLEPTAPLAAAAGAGHLRRVHADPQAAHDLQRWNR